jgi:hypothetical protein
MRAKMTIKSDSQQSTSQKVYRESTSNLLCYFIEFSLSILVIAFLVWVTDVLLSVPEHQHVIENANDTIIGFSIALVWLIVRYWISRKETLTFDTMSITYSTLAYTLSTPWDNIMGIEAHKVTRLFWQQEDKLKLRQVGAIRFNGLFAWLMQKNKNLSYQIPLTTFDRNWRDRSLGHMLKRHRQDLFQAKG